MAGRLTHYTEALAETICERLANGESLRAICKSPGIPPESVVRLWNQDDRSGFAARYARAREIGYQRLADDLLEIADNGTNDWVESNDPENPGYKVNGDHVSRSKLRVEARKWILAKMLPKVYGDRLTTDVTVNYAAKDLTDDAIAALIAGGSGKGAATSSDD